MGIIRSNMRAVNKITLFKTAFWSRGIISKTLKIKDNRNYILW